MSSTVYNPHEFNLKTKTFEQQAYDSAIETAKQIAKTEVGIKVHRVSRKVCNEAFEDFKRKLEATFPSDDYNNLNFLTLKSRENLFFIDLKDRVITIFRNPKAE